MTHPRVKSIVIAQAALAVVAAALLILAVTVVASRALDNCRQLENLKTTLRVTISVSAKDLGRPGTAGYVYYRDHPTELTAAHRAIDNQLANFRPAACGP